MVLQQPSTSQDQKRTPGDLSSNVKRGQMKVAIIFSEGMYPQQRRQGKNGSRQRLKRVRIYHPSLRGERLSKTKTERRACRKMFWTFFCFIVWTLTHDTCPSKCRYSSQGHHRLILYMKWPLNLSLPNWQLYRHEDYYSFLLLPNTTRKTISSLKPNFRHTWRRH